jgi:hypothetical protein
MGFKEEILMNIYRSMTLSQYQYNAPLLGSASTQAKKEMEKKQQRFFNIKYISILNTRLYNLLLKSKKGHLKVWMNFLNYSIYLVR